MLNYRRLQPHRLGAQDRARAARGAIGRDLEDRRTGAPSLVPLIEGLRAHWGIVIALAGGGRGVVAPLPLDEGLRVPRRRLQPARGALRGHEHRVVDRAVDGHRRRAGRPGRRGRHPRRLADALAGLLARATASTASSSPSSAPPGRCGVVARRPPLRRPARRRDADAGRDRHPDRPRGHHPGAGDHVHRRAGARPRHLPHPSAAHDWAPKSSPRDGAHDRRRRSRPS